MGLKCLAIIGNLSSFKLTQFSLHLLALASDDAMVSLPKETEKVASPPICSAVLQCFFLVTVCLSPLCSRGAVVGILAFLAVVVGVAQVHSGVLTVSRWTGEAK